MLANKLNERDSQVESSPASRRSWATGIIVSVVLHIAIVGALIVSGLHQSSNSVVRRPSNVGQLSSEITLLAMQEPVSQTPQHSAATAPKRMSMSASAVPAPMVPEHILVAASTRPTSSSVVDASSTPSSATAVMDAGSPADLMAIGSDYRRRLLEHISQRQKSPPAGLPPGTVVVRFSLARDGNVLSITLASSSGSAALDRAALDSVRDASPMPRIPAGFPDRIAVAIPIDFGQAGRQIGVLRP